jgi:TRAP-type C4-dicarboxylate transport system permease small subunit
MDTRQKLPHRANRIFSFLVEYHLEIALCILVVPMVSVIFAQVIFRYVLRAPPMWTEEFARYVFIWVCFIGAAYTFKRKEHITVEVIYQYIPPGLMPYYKQFINIIVLVLLLVIIYYGMVYVNAALPVGGMIMLCYHIYFMLKG